MRLSNWACQFGSRSSGRGIVDSAASSSNMGHPDGPRLACSSRLPQAPHLHHVRIGMGCIAFVILSILVACGTQPGEPDETPVAQVQPTAAGPADEERPKYGGVATFALRRDPPAGFDRIMTNIYFELHQIGAGIWGRGNLVQRCPDSYYEVCPGMATSWSSNADFTEWTFDLRDDLVWHDDEPFTAEDMAYWFELASGKVGDRRPGIIAADLKLESAEVLNEYRVKLTLTESSPHYLWTIGNASYNIAHPKHLSEERTLAGEVELSPQEMGFVGTGPYIMDNYTPGSGAMISKFDDYLPRDEFGNELPYMDAIQFVIFADPAGMDAAFRTGQLDGGAAGSGYILTGERKALYDEEFGDDVYYTSIAGAQWGLTFNVLKPGPWQDVRVRRAISLWMDRYEGVEAIVGGLGQPDYFIYHSHPFADPDALLKPGWNPETKEQDRIEAEALLEEAGFPDGFEMEMLCLNSQSYIDRCVFIQGQLQQLGVTLNLALVDTAGWTEGRRGIDHDSYLAGPGGGGGPAIDLLEFTVAPHSVNPGAGVRHEDPKVGEFFERIKSAPTQEEELAGLREFEHYWLFEQAYAAPVYYATTAIPFRSYVKGVIDAPESVSEIYDYSRMWLDK